jgi:hypothetical protein
VVSSVSMLIFILAVSSVPSTDIDIVSISVVPSVGWRTGATTFQVDSSCCPGYRSTAIDWSAPLSYSPTAHRTIVYQHKFEIR